MPTFKRFYEAEHPYWLVAPADDAEREERLKQMIEAGESPNIYDAAAIRGKYTFGDLERIGWAERQYSHYDENDYKWKYTGPRSIAYVIVFISPQRGREEKIVWMHPGETTEQAAMRLASKQGPNPTWEAGER